MSKTNICDGAAIFLCLLLICPGSVSAEDYESLEDEVFAIGALSLEKDSDEITSRALTLFKECGNSYPAADFSAFVLHRVYTEKREFDKAREVLQSFKKRFEHNNRFINNSEDTAANAAYCRYLALMAEVEKRAGNYGSAIRYYEKYLEFLKCRISDPTCQWSERRKQNAARDIDSQFSWLIAQCYFDNGEYERAVERINHYISFINKQGLYAPWDDTRHNPDPAIEYDFFIDVYYLLGLSKYKMGNKEEALAAFSTALENFQRGDIMHARPWSKEFADKVKEMKEKTLPEWISRCK